MFAKMLPPPQKEKRSCRKPLAELTAGKKRYIIKGVKEILASKKIEEAKAFFIRKEIKHLGFSSVLFLFSKKVFNREENKKMKRKRGVP